MAKRSSRYEKIRITPQKVRQIFEDYTRFFSKIDWNNSDSLIIFHQSIYRLFALANSDFQILHGSATVTPRGLNIVFGDDGKSIGKTTCACEVARHSKKWIADEFVLYYKGRIFANGEYPLHFKDGSKNYFKFLNRKFNNWIYPKKEKWEIAGGCRESKAFCLSRSIFVLKTEFLSKVDPCHGLGRLMFGRKSEI